MLTIPIITSAALGIAVLGLWGSMIARHAVPELADGRPSIRFHIGAELITGAALLLGAALLAVADGPVARMIDAAALGAILYSTVNSPGYYADQDNQPMVAIFGILTLAALGGLAALLSA